MKIECQVKVDGEMHYGIMHPEIITIVLEGDFNAILKFLREIKFDLETAQKFQLE